MNEREGRVVTAPCAVPTAQLRGAGRAVGIGSVCGWRRGGPGGVSDRRAPAAHVADWLYKCSVQKLVVVISNIEDGEVLERWQFDIECDKTAREDRWV